MGKNLHIHIHRAPAKDAGWDESKHKRDHGKFSSTGHSAEHHEALAAHHAQEAKAKGPSSSEYQLHVGVARAHQEAGKALRAAHSSTGMQQAIHYRNADNHAERAQQFTAGLDETSQAKAKNAYHAKPASADNPYGLSDEVRARLSKMAPKIAAQQKPHNPNAGPTHGSTLGPDMPGGFKIPKPTSSH